MLREHSIMVNKEIVLREHTLVVNALGRLFQHTGIPGKWIADSETARHRAFDGQLQLVVEGREIMFYAEVKREIRQQHVNAILDTASQYSPFIVVAGNIPQAVKQQLKEQKIAYLDGAGNMFLNVPGQLISVEGNKLQKEDKQIQNRAFTKTGLKVVYLLLAQEEAVQWTYREIADRSNVALGNIPTVFAGLKDAGFMLLLEKGKFMLQNKQSLLERWLTGYREVLRPTLYLGDYKWSSNFGDWMNKKLTEGALWGGEPAADILTNHLNAGRLTIYLQGSKHELVKDWRLLPSSNGNVELYHQFWTNATPTEQVIVPPLIAYADLVLTEEPRNIETAEIIYKNYLQQTFE